MKTRIFIGVIVVLIMPFNALYGQLGSTDFLGLPSNPLFGKDIIIYDQPSQNQKSVSVCSSFNGWLYSAIYSTKEGLNYISILKSEDYGMSWSLFREFQTLTLSYKITTCNIIACGNSLSNLKLFLGQIYYDTIYDVSTALVTRFDGLTAASEGDILGLQDFNIYHLAISNDYNNPASGTNPGSFAILYSIQGIQRMNDSIIFLSSNDGGMTFNNHKAVSVTSNHYSKVALNYGVSSLYNSGRYFATWEENDGDDSIPGRIFTAHSEPNYNSPFTTPVRLDNIDPTDANLCRNPTIACQVNNIDNDSLNMSEVVLVEKYDALNHRSDIVGYSNLQAVTSSYFRRFSFTNSAHNNLQPEIQFNYFDSVFMVTYFDSSFLKLPFVTNNYNLSNPNSWKVLSNGYNDSSNLSNPHPQITFSTLDHQDFNVWTSDKMDNLGIALFDSPNSFYTGISEKENCNKQVEVRVYPNPTPDVCKLYFNLMKPTNVKIELYTIMNQKIRIITNQTYLAGDHLIPVDLSSISPGTYIYTFNIENDSTVGKIIVVR